MRMMLCANGPGYSLDSQDISKLLKEGEIESFNNDQHIKGRLILTDYDPNMVFYTNGGEGLIDMFSPRGIRMRRFPDNLHPDDYDGISLFVLNAIVPPILALSLH
jgi:hypothetical protein